MHQAGRIADALNVFPAGRDLSVVKISSDEDNTRTGWRREDTHANRRAMVQTDSRYLDRTPDSRFMQHEAFRIAERKL
jgi:hypothetical protein